DPLGKSVDSPVGSPVDSSGGELLAAAELVAEGSPPLLVAASSPQPARVARARAIAALSPRVRRMASPFVVVRLVSLAGGRPGRLAPKRPPARWAPHSSPPERPALTKRP